VQRRVETYPDSGQTPDFGTFAFDDRGEMVIPLLIDAPGRSGKPRSAAGRTISSRPRRRSPPI
jgi:hypothetical protein